MGALVIVLVLPALAAAQSFPKPAGRINDLAEVIDAATEADLDHRIDLLEQKTSSEIAIATVKSLDGMPVEEYANKLFKQGGIGQAKQDNGVLVVVAPADRAIRIEVGYGLEGVLPDGLAGEVIREQFTPKFRNNDYSGGIRDGVTRLIEIVEKHQVLTSEELARFNQSPHADDDLPAWAVMLICGVFMATGFGLLGSGIRAMEPPHMLLGVIMGGMSFAIAMMFAPGWSLLLVPLAVVSFLVGLRFVGGQSGSGSRGRPSGSSAGRTSSSFGRSSSSSSPSRSSSSSSSFGGGRSGGGGASGKW